VPCRNGHVAERYTSTGQCFACLSASNERRYRSNPSEFKKRSQEWRKKNPEKYARSNKSSRYKKVYGVTIDQVEAMAEAQGNACPACDCSFEERVPHIDHCHATGKVRGLLCGPCNQALGLTKDNPETLRRLAAYLEQ